MCSLYKLSQKAVLKGFVYKNETLPIKTKTAFKAVF